MSEEVRAEQTFGRQIHQFDLAAQQGSHALLILTGVATRVQCGCRNAVVVQQTHLILHQGNQRRNYDGDAALQYSRQLKAQRFAAASRHDCQQIAAGQCVAHYLCLSGTE
jgi:hypothetical protein